MVKHFQTSKGVFKAVDGVDVNVEPSSIVALLGPSGSGKTTLLRLVAGLESPTDGKILFDDFDATNVPVQDRQIGMVFQNYALFNHKTVAENISFGLEVSREGSASREGSVRGRARRAQFAGGKNRGGGGHVPNAPLLTRVAHCFPGACPSLGAQAQD